MAKIYLEPEIDSRGIWRVVNALKKYAPSWITLTDDPIQADVVVYHVNGRLQGLKRKITHHQKPYIIIQYSLNSTLEPNPKEWEGVWRDALFVYSYYDLTPYCDRFYHAPLGVDPVFHYDPTVSRHEGIITSGLSWHTESVREVALAIGKENVIHIGADLSRNGIKCGIDIHDNDLSFLYNRVQYVAGLRRKDGFELPAAEGAVCGATPILFDTPTYRKWYEGLGIFIPEGSRAEVLESLKNVFESEYIPPTEEMIKEAKVRFDWGLILSKFYEHIGAF